MLSILIVPILICGVMWIKVNPAEKFKISVYQGWIIYLYAASYGVAAVLSSWIFLEYFVAWFFEANPGWFSGLSNFIGLPKKSEAGYLDSIAYYIVSSGPVKITEQEEYSAFLTARLSLISVLSIVLTKLFCWLYKFFLLVFRKNNKKILELYEHNSPSDYQLALISARVFEATDAKEDFEHYKESYIHMNRYLKERLRRTLRFAQRFVEDKEVVEENTARLLASYRKHVRGQCKRIKKLKAKVDNEPLLAQITLESGKVYVGVPKEIGRPDEQSIGNSEIVLSPWYSGYRDSKKLSISLTNNYHPMRDEGNFEVDNIVVDKAKVCSVSAFSMKSYKAVQGNMQIEDKFRGFRGKVKNRGGS